MAPPVAPLRQQAQPDVSWVRRLSTLKVMLALFVLVIALFLAGAVWLKNQFLTIDPGKGTPVGWSVRTDRHIATLIQTLEAYVPSLNRDHSRDTYRISLFLVPLDGSKPRTIPIVGGLSPNQFSLAKILGSDGRTLWFDVTGTGGVDLESFELLSAEAVSRATSIPDPTRSGTWPFGPKLEHHLAPVDHAEYLDAAFLRMDSASEPIRLDGPPGALMVYKSDPGLKSTVMVARVDDGGGLAWKVDTGIDRFTLQQILPGERSTAFVGTRPPVPGKVSEPLLVIVDHATGAVVTHSLWV